MQYARKRRGIRLRPKRACEERERAPLEAEQARQAAAKTHAAREEALRKLRGSLSTPRPPNSMQPSNIYSTGRPFSLRRRWDKDAARVSVIETTSIVARYQDPRKVMPFVWYDVSGCGILSIPDWQYLSTSLTKNSTFSTPSLCFPITASLLRILRNCARLQIPDYIVHSKARQHIDNTWAATISRVAS